MRAEDVAIHPELDVAAGGCKEGDSMETVREFVEKIVEGLVGNVDDTPIDRLYDHPAYKPATDTPTMAHTALRELVERAVDEARKLPGLGPTVSTGLQDDLSFSEQNYEDLLATAILNKVIEKFQNERVDDNSNVLHRRPRSKLANDDSETRLNDLEEGCSSLEPFSNDEHSGEENEPRTRQMHVRQEPLSLTIEEQIEEVTTTYTSDDEVRCSKTTVLDFRNARRVPFPEFGMDIVDPSQDSSEESQEESQDLAHVNRITPVESWEENWLFQKRKIQTQSEPVAMLVPNPSADFRALIGDKDAEDTSDLSEFSAQSDDEAEDEKLAEAINDVIPKSAKIGSNFFGDYEEDRNIHESIGSNAEESTNKEAKLQVDINSEPEIISTVNKDDKHQYKMTQPAKILKEKSPECFNNPFDSVNSVTKNSEIPKTPATSMRNSLPDNISEFPVDSDVLQLDANLASINNNEIDENQSKKELSMISHEKTEDKIEINDNQASDNEVVRHSKSSAINGCLKANSRDVDDDVGREVEASGRCNDDGQKVLASLFKEEIKANGDAVGIKDEEVVANDITSEVADRKCQALAQAKADSAKEKLSLSIEANENIGFATPPRPGTIAEREHKKWENAAPIENNPYSEENIQKRLLERQYARRSSDVSGSSSNLQTCPSPPLQIVLGASRPDFRRFGRDYYINEAKFPKGHSIEESGFFTATSRPNSSLSQHSLSTGSDYEQQERSQSVDTESTCSTSSESKTKFSSELQHNNVQIALHRGSMPVGKDFEISETQTRDSRIDKNWNGQNSFDEILERERKNSKNEINAKLNNRENFENTEKPIRRIDLSAYGFENEFNEKNGRRSVESKRVVNKLDLRSFGYDSGLRRTQSNNNIDRRVNSKYSGRNFEGKSNNGLFSAHSRLASLEGSDDGILTKSNEDLIEDASIDCQTFGRITSAKSVPNIGDLYSRVNRTDRAGEYREESVENINSERSTSEKSDECNGFQDNIQSKNNISNSGEVKEAQKSYVGKKLPMPSVRILAQAFNKPTPANPVSTRRSSKSTNVLPRERPTTPEIHIVDTPRQMHSLTARSISREFREGLRQMSSKQVPPLRANVIPEQNRLSDAPSATNPIGSSEDVSVIAPGKLKNNIQFWEQLNRKS